MRNLYASLLFIALIANANAALVDNGTFTTDTGQGLDWLDLSETAEMSYVDAVSSNPGWRHATYSEIESLFASAFPNYYHTDVEGISLSYNGAYAEQEADILNWISLFGLTRPDVGGVQVSRGFFLDNGGVYRMMGAELNSSLSEIASPEWTEVWDEYATAGDDITGVFLVRSSVVPIPAAVWLFGSALAGLGWIRRNRAG